MNDRSVEGTLRTLWMDTRVIAVTLRIPSAPSAPIRSPFTATRVPANASSLGHNELEHHSTAAKRPRSVFSGWWSVLRPFRRCRARDRPVSTALSETADHANQSVGWKDCASVPRDDLHVGNRIQSKFGGSCRKAVRFQHGRNDILIDIPGQGMRIAVRHVAADIFEQLSHGLQRETLPEQISHQRYLALCRKGVAVCATSVKSHCATHRLRFRVHTVA